MILILYSILHYVNIKLKFVAREKYVKLKLAVLEKKNIIESCLVISLILSLTKY